MKKIGIILNDDGADIVLKKVKIQDVNLAGRNIILPLDDDDLVRVKKFINTKTESIIDKIKEYIKE